MSPKVVTLLTTNTAQKMRFSIKDFFSKYDHTFTKEILNGKLIFLYSTNS